jgi:hypothetical protein
MTVFFSPSVHPTVFELLKSSPSLKPQSHKMSIEWVLVNTVAF